jgi:hypothetical protein
VEKESYVLIDFEHSRLSGKEPRFEALWQWPDECKKEKATYAPSADIYSLGQLVEDSTFDLSQSARHFANQLKNDRPTAKKALQLPWITSRRQT